MSLSQPRLGPGRAADTGPSLPTHRCPARRLAGAQLPAAWSVFDLDLALVAMVGLDPS